MHYIFPIPKISMIVDCTCLGCFASVVIESELARIYIQRSTRHTARGSRTTTVHRHRAQHGYSPVLPSVRPPVRVYGLATQVSQLCCIETGNALKGPLLLVFHNIIYITTFFFDYGLIKCLFLS